VLISGASGGVGRGIALACGQAGWEVWIAARRGAEGSAVANEVTKAGGLGRFVVCDVADEGSIDAALAHLASLAGRLHGVVHNSTSGLSSVATPLGDVTLKAVEDHVAVSVRGMYLLARAAWPLLRATHGSLVVTTSEAGFEGKKLLAPYAMVKAAQRGLVRSLAREWGSDGVRVNAVAPLAMTPAMERAFVLEPAMEARVRSRIPLDRVGDPTDDVGRAVRFLLGDEAAYITGQTLMVDGGSHTIS
jgi:NAD(P)-dependent dehydrogenase (short-subunit alcohol dehydrogenase family)